MQANHTEGASYPPPARRPVAGRPALYVKDSTTSRGSENVLSHTFVLWVLRQWWMIVVPAGCVLATIAAVVVLYTHTPKYEAKALLMIEDVTPFVAFSDRVTGRDSRRYIETQLELLRSPVVLEPVLSRPEIAAMREFSDAPDRVKFLQERLSIKPVGRSELYNIAYTSDSARAAADVVNAVIAEYMTIHRNDEVQRSQRVVDILEEERRRRGLEVERLRKRVVDLAKEVTGRDPFGGNQVTDYERALNPVNGLFESLTEVEAEREVRRAELQALMESPGLGQYKVESSEPLDVAIENHESIRARQQAISELEARMQDIRLKAVRYQNNPAYVALHKEWTQRQSDLAQAKTALRDELLTQQRQQHNETHGLQVLQLKQDLESLEARRELLSKRYEAQVKQLQTGGAKSVELEFARAELDREETVFELIATRKLALQTELRAPARVQLRQSASVPIMPVEPIPYKLLLLACSAAAAVPFGLALLREITVRRISDVEQLAQESGLRVLGEVAALPVRYVAVSPQQLSGRLRRDTYIFAESINTLRTNLALADGLGDQQVVAVTSASSAEGKTSVAVSLAMSISNATRQPTLIIDGDMRSPSVAAMLKAKSQPGLFEVLSKNCTLEDAIQRVGHDDLYVLPGGRATRSTHSVVGIVEIEQLIDELRARFSKIVIDTPPILGASESLLLAKAADSVLFCSLCDASRVRQVRLAIERLHHAQVNVAGAVLSGTPARRYEYVYGYYANRIEADE